MSAAALRSIANNSALRGSLHRAQSSPNLRKSAARLNGAAVIAPSTPPPALPRRSFVSTVLLTRDAYDAKRVAELKSELKSRGLSTTGKRADLIQRLIKHDQERVKVLPVEPLDKRFASTTAAAASTKPDESSGVALTDGSGPTIPHPSNMEPGQVSANFHDPAIGVVVPDKLEAHANAPGVPPERSLKAPNTFVINIPYEPAPVERQAEIPLLTSYFHPEESHFEGHADYEGFLAHEPKVRTVSGEETYLGGGVSHHHPTFGLAADGTAAGSDGGESSSTSFTSAVSSLWTSFQNDLGISTTGGQASSSQNATPLSSTAASKLLKSARDTLNSATGSSGRSSGGSASYSTSSASGSSSSSNDGRRPMTEEERSGLYVLGGIVAGGFLLGGLGKQSKRKQERLTSSIQQQIEQIRKEVETLSERDLQTLVERAEEVLKK